MTRADDGTRIAFAGWVPLLQVPLGLARTNFMNPLANYKLFQANYKFYLRTALWNKIPEIHQSHLRRGQRQYLCTDLRWSGELSRREGSQGNTKHGLLLFVFICFHSRIAFGIWLVQGFYVSVCQVFLRKGQNRRVGKGHFMSHVFLGP